MEPLGSTGTFPQGKLAPDDEGGLRMAVGEKDGKIVIDFGKQVSWIGLSPKDARDLARLLLDKTGGPIFDGLEEGQKKLYNDLNGMLHEILNGEFGDFSNEKYATPKVELVRQLKEIIQNSITGKYDG